jgi:hypothetical protein
VRTMTHCCCCFWSAVRFLGTNLTATWCMPNCQNTLACPSTNSHLFSNVVNGLMNDLLNSCNSFRSCVACGSSCVFIIVN